MAGVIAGVFFPLFLGIWINIEQGNYGVALFLGILGVAFLVFAAKAIRY